MNEESAWKIKNIDVKCINISTCSALSESIYTELPDELKKPKKGFN